MFSGDSAIFLRFFKLFVGVFFPATGPLGQSLKRSPKTAAEAFLSVTLPRSRGEKNPPSASTDYGWSTNQPPQTALLKNKGLIAGHIQALLRDHGGLHNPFVRPGRGEIGCPWVCRFNPEKLPSQKERNLSTHHFFDRVQVADFRSNDGGNWNIFSCSPRSLGKWSNLTTAHTFQLGGWWKTTN